MARGTRGGGRFGRIWIGALLIAGCAGEGALAPDGEQEWASIAPDDSESGSAHDPPPLGEPQDSEMPLVRQLPAEFAVLDAGREPRSVVRYQYRAGEKSTVRLRMNLSLSIAGKGRTARVSLPTQVDVESSTLKVDGSGNARRLHRFVRASTLDLSVSGFNGSSDLRKLAEDFNSRVEHLAIEEIVDRRGVVVEASARLTEFADPALRKSLGSLQDALEQCTVPWPEQPIGVGARWVRKNKRVDDGLSYDQEVVTTLVARDGSRVETQVEAVEQAPRQEHALPDGQVAEIQLAETRAAGTNRIQLGPFAVRSESQAKTRQVMVIGGVRFSLDATTTVELSTLGKQF